MSVGLKFRRSPGRTRPGLIEAGSRPPADLHARRSPGRMRPGLIEAAHRSTAGAAGPTIRSRMCSGMLLCNLWGRKDRFSKPSAPLARKRAIHLWAVVLEIPKTAAASFTVVPSWSTQRTSSSRLYGINLAFLWVFIRPSWGLVFFWKCQHSRSGPNGQQPICRSHLVIPRSLSFRSQKTLSLCSLRQPFLDR